MMAILQAHPDMSAHGVRHRFEVPARVGEGGPS